MGLQQVSVQIYEFLAVTTNAIFTRLINDLRRVESEPEGWERRSPNIPLHVLFDECKLEDLKPHHQFSVEAIVNIDRGD